MRGFMTPSPSRHLALPLLALALAGADGARSEIFSATNSWHNGELAIPDGEPEGVVTTIDLLAPLDYRLQELRVTLELASAYNGDLYVTLSHGDGFSVLLNRVGRDESTPFGYGDPGFSSVTFSDSAPNDVHIYRTFTVGDPALPLGGPLTGTWQPDGRTTDPDSVLGSDTRSAMLSSFVGSDPSGEWTLFLADLSLGGSSQLVSWSIEVTATAVPEPSAAALALLGSGAVWALRRHRRTSAR